MTDDDIAPDEPAPEPTARAGRPARPVGRTVRAGCIVLALLGALGIYLGLTTATDPEQAQCTQARAILEDEDVEDADDIGCEEARSQAATLAAESEGTDDEVDEVSTESAIRTFGLIVAGIGLLQVVGALLTMRTLAKPARLLALLGTALGIVFSPLGLLGIPILGFVAYALFFSADARAVFGEPTSRFLRPRGPRTTP